MKKLNMNEVRKWERQILNPEKNRVQRNEDLTRVKMGRMPYSEYIRKWGHDFGI